MSECMDYIHPYVDQVECYGDHWRKMDAFDQSAFKLPHQMDDIACLLFCSHNVMSYVVLFVLKQTFFAVLEL